MAETTIAEIRERANSVLDGMTAHRTRVARDALLLCDEVENLRNKLAVAEALPKDSMDFAAAFGRVRR